MCTFKINTVYKMFFNGLSLNIPPQGLAFFKFYFFKLRRCMHLMTDEFYLGEIFKKTIFIYTLGNSCENCSWQIKKRNTLYFSFLQDSCRLLCFWIRMSWIFSNYFGGVPVSASFVCISNFIATYFHLCSYSYFV